MNILNILRTISLIVGIALVLASVVITRRNGESEISRDIVKEPVFILGTVLVIVGVVLLFV